MLVLSDFSAMQTKKGKTFFESFCFAEVTATTTTGCMWWKRTQSVRRKIARRYGSGMWYFVDNGEFCPGYQAGILERGFLAREALESA